MRRDEDDDRTWYFDTLEFGLYMIKYMLRGHLQGTN